MSVSPGGDTPDPGLRGPRFGVDATARVHWLAGAQRPLLHVFSASKTREPRLVYRAGEEGRYVNMIVHVVTYYTVQNGRMIPIEHIRAPQGWRALAVGE